MRRLTLIVLLFAAASPVFSQDNSPYSRFGIGDLTPNTNVNSRGMGGISAAYRDFTGTSINYSNPATFGSFAATRTPNTNKVASGRAVLDIGMTFDNRTLQEPNTVTKFRASNALFSHVQLGIPLKPNWGLSFGIRPISRISYKMLDAKRTSIDSTITQNTGDGGSYLASIGTGVRIGFNENQHLSLGVTGGYYFGKMDYSRRLSILNDSLSYTSGNFENKTTYGNLYFEAGFQYEVRVSKTKPIFLTLGAYGNVSQKIRASRDNITETYFFDESVGNSRIDSVSVTNGIKGKITYPGSYTAGIVLEKRLTDKAGSWLVGLDVVQSKWSDYRYFGQPDANVQDKWTVKLGGEVRPMPKPNYFSNVTYRLGFFYGPDYLKIVGRELPTYGATLGFGLPLRNFNPQGPNQFTVLNLGFEYSKRGNDDSPLKENMFRISLGFSLSDIWFIKRKYD